MGQGRLSAGSLQVMSIPLYRRNLKVMLIGLAAKKVASLVTDIFVQFFSLELKHDLFHGKTGGGGRPRGGVGVTEQALMQSRTRAVSPFVFTRRGSMFSDEDGDLAHEFYEETIITMNGQKRAKLSVHENLVPRGIVKLDPSRIHADFPVILYEV
uniref:tumor suppressor candidate 2-like n=1 Tax=Jaculus jaculus TaxID=51337 RepID=UPI001E1B00FE|nr:tumor suppressor candidate 2-like [Jaculus jaculus]